MTTKKAGSTGPGTEIDTAAADQAWADAAMAKPPIAEVSVDDIEPLEIIPETPAGDGLGVVRHNVFDCIAICDDDHLAGLLLFKIIMLCRYSKLEIDGKRWYVRARKKLCRDVRQTRHQYDRALSVLKKLGFVETRKVPFEQMHIFGAFTAFRATKLVATTLKKYVKGQEVLKSQAKKKAGWK